jgi:dTDP-4-dehydrorhamnose 3,5-epimerase
MKFTALPLEGAYLIEPELYSDDRGHFFRYFCKNEFAQIAHTKEWVQCNHSYTKAKGSIRGMHYQLPPFAEIKLVRCIAGHIIDVIVDLRQGSPTYLQWTSVELSAANRHMIYIPEGFAHGFQTFTDHCELLYHHTEFYRTGAEGGLRYNDERLQIRWPLLPTVISDRDCNHPILHDSFVGIKL